ncbi:MAG: helix-turn-helix transcriptional regulator [Proteobacteria bacterium]|nr:helix-turn-helix transcriptional regulator [Pseudomonadota bacterium]
MIARTKQKKDTVNNTLKSNLSGNIIKVRKKRGISQDRLSKRADLSLSTIVNVENSKFNPTIKTLDKVAKGLEVPIYSLFMDTCPVR